MGDSLAEDLGAAFDKIAADAAAAATAVSGSDAKIGESAAAAAAETAAAANVAGSAMEQWAADQLKMAAEAQAAAEAAAAAAKEIQDAYAALAAEMGIDLAAIDAALDDMDRKFFATAADVTALRFVIPDSMSAWEESINSVRADMIDLIDELQGTSEEERLLAETTNILRDSDEDLAFAENALRDVTTALGTDAMPAAARAMDTAASSARTATYFWGLSGNAIHWIISGSAELLAVTLPAMVALGAAAFDWAQGAGMVYEHMTALYTATEAWGQAAHQTMGEILGLNGAWQHFQNLANADVYQALGAGINILKESFSNLAAVGLKVGQIFDAFAAKLVYDFSSAGKAGQTMGELLDAMVPDLVKIGQVFGNLGAAIASFASQMPGLAEFLLTLLDRFLGVIKVVVEFSSEFRIGSWSVLTFLMAGEELLRWGGLAVNMLSRLGFGVAEVGQKFLTLQRLGAVLSAPFYALASAIPRLMQGLGGLTMRIAPAESGLYGLGVSMGALGQDMEESVAEVPVWQAALASIGGAALGFLIYRLASARTAAQAWADSLQEDAEKASDLDVLQVISSNIAQLNAQIADNSKAIAQNVPNLNDASDAASRYSGNINEAGIAIGHYTATNAAYEQALRQQAQDAQNVVTGASQIARAYGLTVPEAMTLAQSAGVNLTGALKNQKGQWTALGDQVRDAMQGYQDMGQTAGQVGEDMLALAISEGETASKMQSVNQAMDSFMQTLTGGTGDLASFVTSMSNLGSVAGTTANNLGTSTATMNLSASQFANALKSMSSTGAAAWTNLDQVVGSTAPTLLDWLRTAGSETQGTGANVKQAGLDMISALLPFVGTTKDAQTEILGLAEDAGISYEKFGQLKSQVDSSHASIGGLNSIVAQATNSLGDMASVAENLGDVMNSQVTSAISAAALKATGFDTDVTGLANAMAHGSYEGKSAAYWAAQAGNAYNSAGNEATEAAGKVAGANQKASASAQRAAAAAAEAWKIATEEIQSYINALHGKTVTVQENYQTSVGVSTGAVGRREQGAGGGFVTGPGTRTSDSVAARLSAGEYVVRASAVDYWGRATMDAINAKGYQGGGIVPGSASPVASAIAAGGGGGTMVIHQVIEVNLDGRQISTEQRTQSLVYNRRNPQNNLSLLRR